MKTLQHSSRHSDQQEALSLFDELTNQKDFLGGRVIWNSRFRSVEVQAFFSGAEKMLLGTKCNLTQRTVFLVQENMRKTYGIGNPYIEMGCCPVITTNDVQLTELPTLSNGGRVDTSTEESTMNATQIKTCKDCPFARLIEDDRYVCTNSETASDTVRGNWEVTRASCHDAIAQLTTPEALPEEAPKTTKLTKHPFAYDWSVFNGQHSFSSSMYGKCECYECKPPAAPELDPQPLSPSEDELKVYDDYRKQAYPEQFPPDLNIEAQSEQNEARRLGRVVPVSAVQAIAKVPDYYLERIKSAGTLRPDTVLAFMRIWGATQSDAKEIVRTVNWLVGAPGFDINNTLTVEGLLVEHQKPIPTDHKVFFGVDLKEIIEPEYRRF